MINLCWIRRDLRLHDHLALSNALREGPTVVVFIFDKNILDKLKNKEDKRVTFIYESLIQIETELQKKGSSLIIRYGDPIDIIPSLAKEFKSKKVFANRDYEPYAKDRDSKVGKKLSSFDIEFIQFKDSVFFERKEILTNQGGIYKVFTPYKNKWLEKFEETGKMIPNFECKLNHLHQFKNPKNILSYDWYKEIGFIETNSILKGGQKEALKRLKNFENVINNYDEARDYPSLNGTSMLSAYIRFGNLSVRDMLRAGISHHSKGSKIWISEIIWRDFYQMILDSFPHVAKGSFKREYDEIKYPGGAKEFNAWYNGNTGFPIVDAAMRCLNQTGTMHNRLRMVVASFLCKTLLVDWRKGEAYFAEKLLDFDLAANNGGWQWSSSSGCDAQPYFRIFNPYSQSEKFDSDGIFIREWIPELAHLKGKEIHHPEPILAPDYPRPIVSYELNRKKCLEIYSVLKKA